MVLDYEIEYYFLNDVFNDDIVLLTKADDLN